jgi:hypothetical protein
MKKFEYTAFVTSVTAKGATPDTIETKGYVMRGTVRALSFVLTGAACALEYASKLEEDLFVIASNNHSGSYVSFGSPEKLSAFVKELIRAAVLDARFRKLCQTHMVWCPPDRHAWSYRTLRFTSSTPKTDQIKQLRVRHPGVTVYNDRYFDKAS